MFLLVVFSFPQGETGAEGLQGPPGRMGDEVRKLIPLCIDKRKRYYFKRYIRIYICFVLFFHVRAKEGPLDSLEPQEKRETE